MKGAVVLDVDPDDENDVVSINTDGILQSLSQLSRLNIPTAAEVVHRILACFKFGQNTETVSRKRQHVATTSDKRTAGETDEERRATGKRNKTGEDKWQCKDCNRVFSSKSYLDRHINNEHSAKRRRLLQHEVFECDDCDCVFATEAALKDHETTHASCSNAPKSTKYKCDLCDKERTGIYNHYKSLHKIEYPEQILFYNGNALVRSAIDSKGGKAPWFKKEKENVTKRYKDVTCRLCDSETNFDDTEILEAHYMLMHMVNPELLNNLNFIFRAAKGSHLGLSASNPRRNVVSTPVTKHISGPRVKKTENGKIRWLCQLCDKTFSNQGNLNRHVINSHTAKNSGKPVSDCHYSNKGDKGSSKKDKCTLCHKNIASIYKHYGNVHNIEYPEQIMIENGNVLVLSNINTHGGQAPWFIKEKAKMQTFKPYTCRLCDTEFNNSAMLEKHYRSDHSVIPSALNDLQYMFRATKGAHLEDLPTQTPSRRKHRAPSRPSQNNPQGSDNKTEIKCKPGTENKNKKLIIQVEKKEINGMIIYKCEECEVATSSYDASVEHAQLHYLENYKPITETCQICKLAFEPQCFADHTSNHSHDSARKILIYNPSNLLNDDWFNIFQGLPETLANQIRSSSVYEHTRAVKINMDEVTGIPLYQCQMCGLYVHPQEVKEHCNNENACIKNKSKDYYCPECDIFFYSSVAITEHYKEHKNGRDINSFRKATFNCRQDTTINKALRGAQSASRLVREALPRDKEVPRPVEEIPIEMQRGSRPSIVIVENKLVSEFCTYCKKYVMNSEFEAHAATHKSNKNISIEDDSDLIMEEAQEENRSDSHDEESINPRDVASQNEAVKTVRSNDGRGEGNNSDGDPYLINYSYDVQVHVQKEEVDEVFQSNDDDLANTNNQNDFNSEDMSVDKLQHEKSNSKRSAAFEDSSVMVEINDCFSEELANNLKMDLVNLFNETECDTSESSSTNDNLTTQDLLNILGSNTPTKMGNPAGNNETDASQELNNNEEKLPTESENAAISQDIFASSPNENQVEINVKSEISMDVFSEAITTQTNNSNNSVINNTNTNKNESTYRIIDTINLVDDDEDEVTTESNSRRCSDDILSEMLTDDDSNDLVATLNDYERNERKRLIDETKRIMELMFSRD